MSYQLFNAFGVILEFKSISLWQHMDVKPLLGYVYANKNVFVHV